MSSQFKYQEIDFLIPSQEFIVNFSYVSGKGLSFIREYVLRLINIAPMTKMQIAVYFGLSDIEVTEAIDDLIEQDFIKLNSDGRLGLTELANKLFTDVASDVSLTTIEESTAKIKFDLATFSYFKRDQNGGLNNWACGLKLNAPPEHLAYATEYVKTEFQDEFFQIAENNYLPNSVTKEKHRPHLYMINSVIPTFNSPLRIKVDFKIDHKGDPVLLEKFSNLSNSDQIHSLIAEHLDQMKRGDNAKEIIKALELFGDRYTAQFLDEQCQIKSLVDLQDGLVGEIIGGVNYNLLLGPIYQEENWKVLEKEIQMISKHQQVSNKSNNALQLTWIAPSNPFWGMTSKVGVAFESVQEAFRDNKGLTAKVFLPIGNQYDKHAAKTWLNIFKPYAKLLNGIREGFCDGNVEILHIENELVAISYHVIDPERLPVTMPIGFFTKDRHTINHIGKILNQYLTGYAAYNEPNDCGHLQKIIGR
ncbi:hypothetical protein ACSR4G_09175 [Acinetobacter baumannii]|jgi:hypothetical protein|uniref:Uncharacterized protein n=1 Tax=Acinetobacter junii TaxID=40215 RepID=A0AAW5R830_ACIJU|nr:MULTISPECIES: hypothetical protein [Acinetobacter]AYX85278.1 hypothetical protein EGX84_00375 [Acinetobacter baumannii]MBF9262552.1 hypothetical protein [Acinetobacter baumannii]MCB5210313.1 hypothetical protein [Acinetobacter baumannii]MCG5776541.1 hypothetical protein [Acinetobacter baumannii]MCG5784353.1 hypothetical protein [Acinetobacter baumannii]